MAEDIMITVSADLQKALDDMKNLENHIKQTQASLNNNMQPAVNTTSGKITQMGNRVKSAGEKIKNAIGTEAALAFTAAGAAATNFAKQCVDSAIKSESAWNRFGALVQGSGGQWDGQEKAVKSMVKNHSNQFGYLVSDTREAGQALMQFGVSYQNLEPSLRGVAAVAARTGMTQAEASNMVISAMNGRAMQLKKLTGLDIENYKNQDGTIDQLRLMNDLYEQNRGALEKYGNSTEAQMNRINNEWSAFKTSIGQALLPVVKIIADVISAIVHGFNQLPAPVKTVIATLLLIGGAISVVIGALGFLAPVLTGLGSIIAAIGSAGGVVAGLTAGFGGLTAGLGVLGTALGSILLPVLAVIAAFAALYAVGRYMGWWNSLSDMLGRFAQVAQQVGQIIWDSLVKAWEQIQASLAPLGPVFSQLVSTLSMLWSMLTGSGQAAGEAGGGFNAFGVVAALVGGVLMRVVIVVKLVIAAIGMGISTLTAVIQIIMTVAGALGSILGVLGQLINGQISFGEAWNQIGSILSSAGSAIMTIMQQMADNVFNILDGLTGGMLSKAHEWVQGLFQGGLEAGQGLLDGITSSLANIPNVIGDALGNIGGIITSALSNLGNKVAPGGGLTAGIMAVLAPLPTAVYAVFSRLWPMVQPALMGFINGIVSWFAGLGTRIGQAIMTLPMVVSMYFGLFIQTLTMRLNQARAIAGMLAGMIRQAIVSRITSIVARVRMVFMRVVQVIRTRLNQARAIAGMLAGMIRQVIVTRFNQLVGRVRAVFSRVVSTVRNRLANAVSAAREKAQEIVTNIATKVAEVPQKVADEFNKVADRVRSALANAAAAAASGARDIVNRFLSGLGVASPGIAQRTAAWEFNSIVGIIQDSGVRAVKATKDMATGISSMWLRNKPELGTIGVGMSMEDFQNIPRLPLPVGVGMDVLGQNIARPDFAVPQTGMPRVTNNTQNTTDDHTVHYHIDRITLECSELTQEQSRRVLYNALDGLYGRGT